MPWKKGESGNPSGLSKAHFEFAAKCRAAGPKCLKVLVEALSDADGRIRVQAARELLDRGYGRPLQTVDQTVHTTPVEVANFGPPLELVTAPALSAGENGNGKPARN